MVIEHDLKTWPCEHDAAGNGSKPFEVRGNTDRSFGVGDILRLRRWDPHARYIPSGPSGNYLDEDGRVVQHCSQAHTHRMRVTYVLHGGRFGLPPGMCVMGIASEPSPDPPTKRRTPEEIAGEVYRETNTDCIYAMQQAVLGDTAKVRAIRQGAIDRIAAAITAARPDRAPEGRSPARERGQP